MPRVAPNAPLSIVTERVIPVPDPRHFGAQIRGRLATFRAVESNLLTMRNRQIAAVNHPLWNMAGRWGRP